MATWPFSTRNTIIGAGVTALALTLMAAAPGCGGGDWFYQPTPEELGEEITTDTDSDVAEEGEEIADGGKTSPTEAKSSTTTDKERADSTKTPTSASTPPAKDGLPCDGELFPQAGGTTEATIGLDGIKQIETRRTTMFLRGKKGRLECKANGLMLDGKPVTAEQIRGAKNFEKSLITDRPDIEIKLTDGREIIAGNVMAGVTRWDRNFSPK